MELKFGGVYPKRSRFFSVSIGKEFKFRGKWCRVTKFLPGSFAYEFRNPTDADPRVQQYIISFWYWDENTSDGMYLR